MCNCGKKRMAQYSSKQLRQQASGEVIAAAETIVDAAYASETQSGAGTHGAPRAVSRRS